jgi:ligand-binding sensor domain-containing protein/serine phosphatase RsbU (regulator of sigma subunit)
VRKIVLIVSFVMAIGQLLAQQHNIRQFTTKHGLPNLIVNATCEDHLGRMWFATQNGICYFDGKSFVTFDDIPELQGLDASSILQDKNRTIWIAAYGQGVVAYDNRSFTFYTEDDGLPSNEIKALFVDQSNRLWVATKKGLVFLENGKFEPFVDENGIFQTKTFPQTITQTADGTLWVGTWGGGLVKINQNKCTYFGASDGVLDDWIFTLNANENSLYIGTTDKGVVRYANGKFEQLNIPEMQQAWINAIIIGKSSLDVLTETEVFRIQGDDYSILDESKGLLTNGQYNGSYDKFGNLWLTSEFGVSCIKKEKIYNFSEKTGLLSTKTSSVYKTKNGNILIGTTGYGFNVISQKNHRIQQAINHESLESLTITAFSEWNEELWVSGSYGISIFKKENGQYTFNKQITSFLNSPTENIHVMKVDQQNRLWMTSYGKGVYYLQGNDTIQINMDSGLPSNEILTLHCAQNGDIWLSINQYGLVKIHQEQFTHYTTSNGLPDNTIFSIAEDNHGNLYFGNKTGGLTVFDGNQFYQYTKKDGLLSNLVNAIAFDDENNCWIGTDKGINKIFFDQNHQITAIISLNESTGLITEEINQNALVYDGKHMWAATNGGLYMLETAVEVDKSIRPLIVSKGVRLFFDAVDWTIKGNNTFDELGFPASLELSYLDNHLTFEFNCVTLNDVKYSYIMEGFDADWSPWTNKNDVLYSNLPPGSYQFKVKAIDSYGVESENVLTIEVVILPPFWQTWWFRIVVILVLALSIYGIFKWRTKALLERQQELEQQVEERTAEVVLQKNEAEAQRHLVEEKNKEISDSINYAERIQRSLLANEKMLSSYLNDYFIFFQPKDVVSGDFYWASPLNNGNLAIVNADSTGHGVPGAIMSMLNMNSLKESVEGKGLCAPHEILNNTRKIIKDTLANDGSAEGGKDGMDCSIVCFDLANKKIEFAAANNPVWVVRPIGEGNAPELIEFKPDKMPVGKHDRDHETFTLQTFDLQSGDIIYTLTDGMPDQFGGPKGKKYMYKQLKELLVEISQLPLTSQKEKLIEEFNNWKSDQEQVDDVCIIGVRV